METKQFIGTLKKKSRSEEIVALRLALCDKLFEASIPVRHIANVLNMSTRNVYYAKCRHQSLVNVKDKQAVEAQKEIESHKIQIKPTLVAVNDYLIKPKGVVMIIDNEIY